MADISERSSSVAGARLRMAMDDMMVFPFQ
jgi:hypothetical protein